MNLERLIDIFFDVIGEAKGEMYISRRMELFGEAGDGRIEKSQQSDILEVAIRIYHEGRLGFGYLTVVDEGALISAVEKVKSMLPYQKIRENFCFPGPGELRDVEGIYDPAIEDLDLAVLEDLALGLERDAREFDRRVVTTRNARVSAMLREDWIVNSEGVNYRGRKTIFEEELMVVAEDSGVTGDSWGYEWAFNLGDLPPIGGAVAQRAVNAIGGDIPATGKYGVILENRVAAMLLDTLFSGFNGESAAKKRSPLIGKEGKRVFSEDVSIVIDGRSNRGPMAFPFDGEGSVTRRTPVVEKGVFVDWIYDCEYGKSFGKQPSGSVVRGDLKSLPSLAPFNFHIVPSDRSRESIVTGMKDGIFITELMGLHTVDPITWQFSLGARGFEIHNGEMGRPLQQFTISGDFLSMLERAIVLDDLFFMGGSGAPSIFVEEVNVAGK